MHDSIIDDAKALVRAGLSVVAVHGINDDGTCTCGDENCDRPGKHPRGRWRERCSVAATEEIIEAELRRHPDSNLGVVTGEVSGVIVLDIDSEEGKEALSEALGLKDGELPLAPTVRTGGGGWHVYVRWPKDATMAPRTGVRVLPGVDIRAEGAFVVVPPSRHASGSRYEWLPGRSVFDVELPEIDLSVFQRRRGRHGTQDDAALSWYDSALVHGTPTGKRNQTAARLAGRYFGLGLSRTEAETLLSAWNEKCQPPLERDELTTVIESIMHRERDEETVDREQKLEIISSLLGDGVRLRDVRRITGEPTTLELVFDQGSVAVSTQQLMSPRGLQTAVAEATKIVIRRRSATSVPTHEQVAQRILDVARDVETGGEATAAGEIMHYVRLYLSEVSMAQGEVPASGAFYRNGKAWFSLEDFCRHMSARWRINISLRQASQRLGAAGAERRQFRTVEGRTRIVRGVEWNDSGV